jgi:hypothetical protein
MGLGGGRAGCCEADYSFLNLLEFSDWKLQGNCTLGEGMSRLPERSFLTKAPNRKGDCRIRGIDSGLIEKVREAPAKDCRLRMKVLVGQKIWFIQARELARSLKKISSLGAQRSAPLCQRV